MSKAVCTPTQAGLDLCSLNKHKEGFFTICVDFLLYSTTVLKVYEYTLMFCFVILLRGGNSCDFLFAPMNDEPIAKGVYS